MYHAFVRDTQGDCEIYVSARSMVDCIYSCRNIAREKAKQSGHIFSFRVMYFDRPVLKRYWAFPNGKIK